jgi:hypothetical protein
MFPMYPSEVLLRVRLACAIVEQVCGDLVRFLLLYNGRMLPRSTTMRGEICGDEGKYYYDVSAREGLRD